MRKREILLRALTRLLFGDSSTPDTERSKTSSPAEGGVPRIQPKVDQADERRPELTVIPMMETKDVQVNQQTVPTIDEFPKLTEEIKDLLRSADWDEVNQGLELLVSTTDQEQFQLLSMLIDPGSLRIAHHQMWQTALGISTSHEINAVAKIADLAGALDEVTSIHLNRAQFANEIDLDLNLLSSAAQLQTLVVNGGSVQNLDALTSLAELRTLALLADNIEWDTDEHKELFYSLNSLTSLTLNQWPWEDLTPLSSLSSLERLDLRGGELSSLEGVDNLRALTRLSLSDFYSLSSITEISALQQLSGLRLFNLGISSLEGLEELDVLSEIEIECSDLEDVSVLGSLKGLTFLRLDCGREVSGLGSLAMAPQLNLLKLGDIPEFTIGYDHTQRLGRSDLDRLCTVWKDVGRRSRRLSCLFAEGADLGVVLIGLNVFETLANHISPEEFSRRLHQLTSRWGDSLLSRVYWPKKSASSTVYPFKAPIGQWLNKARFLVNENTISKIAESLGELLPQSPHRA
jgi:hypothetical protein